MTLPVVLLHFFGSSRREWDDVARLFGPARPVLALDLPGFGDAAALDARDVAGMAEHVDGCIVGAGFEACVLVGHSMSGKVAAFLAARRPAYLRGLVLVASSPPSPEPMGDDARAKLMAFDGTRKAAASYIDGLTAKRLSDALRAIAIADAMRSALPAWRAWVTRGSREDCTTNVGTLTLPTLLIAGRDDPSLGPEIQRTLVMPHAGDARLVIVDGGHALPFENPVALHREIDGFCAVLEQFEQPRVSTRPVHHEEA